MAQTIFSVEPANFNGERIGMQYSEIPEPSAYEWAKQDISGENAGRTMTTDAWKNLKAKARTLNLTWNNRTFDIVSKLVHIFDHEYLWVTYIDAESGKLECRHFYVGDMTANMYTTALYGGLWSTFKLKLIQAKTDKIGEATGYDGANIWSSI